MRGYPWAFSKEEPREDTLGHFKIKPHKDTPCLFGKESHVKVFLATLENEPLEDTLGHLEGKSV